MRDGAAPDHHGHSPTIKVELLAPAHCAPGRAERGYKFYPPLKLRVFVDDITVFLIGRNKEFVEMAEEVLERLERERGGGEGLEVNNH